MKEKRVGFIKYEGALVEGGMMDARKQARALLAVDHALRYFIAEQIYDHVHDGIHDNKVQNQFRNKIHKEVQDIGFEIPVKIKEGSWELLLMYVLRLTGLEAKLKSYIARLGARVESAIVHKYLENIKDLDIKDLYKTSADMIKWTAKIAMHLGSIYEKPDKIKEHPNNKLLVVVINDEGERLDVPKVVLDKCIHYDGPRLLKALVDNIEEGRSLRIGLKGESGDIIIDSHGKVCLAPKPLGDMIFPELEHGESFELKGEVMSENKISNSMEFEYKEGVLVAYPEIGTIVPHGDKIFKRCNLKGTVYRVGTSLKPKLCFNAISIIK